jgi:hypothetical protein
MKTGIQESLLPFGPGFFVFQFVIQKYKIKIRRTVILLLFQMVQDMLCYFIEGGT